MPSRKIISVFIICSALVISIILSFGKKSTTIAIRELGEGGLLSKGPGLDTKIPENQNWQADLSPFTLKSSEVNALVASSTTNLTDKVSQSLMANYLSLRESGNLNNTSADMLINQALEFTEASSVSTSKYSTANILVSPDNSQAAISAYGSELGRIFKINKSAQNRNEMRLFYEIIQSGNKSRISELKDIASTYKQTAEAIRSIRVPSDYISLHLDMLNNLNEIGNSVDEMAVIFDDPMRSIRGVGGYQSSFISFAGVIDKIRLKILKESKVVYKQGESGYYLYYGI